MLRVRALNVQMTQPLPRGCATIVAQQCIVHNKIFLAQTINSHIGSTDQYAPHSWHITEIKSSPLSPSHHRSDKFSTTPSFLSCLATHFFNKTGNHCLPSSHPRHKSKFPPNQHLYSRVTVRISDNLSPQPPARAWLQTWHHSTPTCHRIMTTFLISTLGQHYQ